ncbi:MAG: acetate--CoA ligase family protein [Proteobacteria bacterium]|nr:acetate--CoA ligase family protein [Pseudomonadota bacterium]
MPTLHVDLADLRALGRLLSTAALAPPPETRAANVQAPREAPSRSAEALADRVRQLHWTHGPALGDQPTKTLLADFGLAAPMERIVRSASAAAQAVVEDGGQAVALRVLAKTPTRAATWGGERQDIASAPEARRAFREIVAACRRHWPRATIHGVLVSRLPTETPSALSAAGAPLRAARVPAPASELSGGLLNLGAKGMIYLRWVSEGQPRSAWVVARCPTAEGVSEGVIERLLAAARTDGAGAGSQPPRLRAALGQLLARIGSASAALAATVEWVGLERVGFSSDGSTPLLIETAALLRP